MKLLEEGSYVHIINPDHLYFMCEGIITSVSQNHWSPIPIKGVVLANIFLRTPYLVAVRDPIFGLVEKFWFAERDIKPTINIHPAWKKIPWEWCAWKPAI